MCFEQLFLPKNGGFENRGRILSKSHTNSEKVDGAAVGSYRVVTHARTQTHTRTHTNTQTHPACESTCRKEQVDAARAEDIYHGSELRPASSHDRVEVGQSTDDVGVLRRRKRREESGESQVYGDSLRKWHQ